MPLMTEKELLKRRKKAQKAVDDWERKLSLAFTKLKSARRRAAYYDRAIEKMYKEMATGGTKRVVDL